MYTCKQVDGAVYICVRVYLHTNDERKPNACN
jgi:hypothetical protein